MRAGSAAAAAAVVLCAAVTAADGAGAVAAGPPLAKGEVQAEVDAALRAADIHDDGTIRVVVLYAENWSGHVPPPECVLDRRQPLPASAAQVDRLLDALDRDGWRPAAAPETAGSIRSTPLHRGGWRLTVSREGVFGAGDPGRVTVGAYRPGC
ncbi:hypothetical protein [Streptomyces sp. NPDC021020]|uniref:hypothetical protein n=1 Tax=Streptomyces sp. NPDC021020 TaxID=3365109 RepID=UPI0037B52A47